MLANLFAQGGKIVDCRLCSDPNSALRFAFIEFSAEAAVHQVFISLHANDKPCQSTLDQAAEPVRPSLRPAACMHVHCGQRSVIRMTRIASHARTQICR